VPSTGLQDFRSSYGLAADGTQDTATPAGDGVPNLTKYAFNMMGSGTGQTVNLATPNSAVLAPTGTAGLPLIGIDNATGRLQVTFIRRKGSTPAPGVTYSVEFSQDLGIADPWAVDATASEAVDPISNILERVTVQSSNATPDRLFVRVKVTATN